jgi:hypothetical protein
MEEENFNRSKGDVKERIAGMVRIKATIDFKLQALASGALKADQKNQIINQILELNQIMMDSWLHIAGVFEWDEDEIQNGKESSPDKSFVSWGKIFKDDWEEIILKAHKQGIPFSG